MHNLLTRQVSYFISILESWPERKVKDKMMNALRKTSVVYGEDFSDELVRLLKEKEFRLYGEYRTSRLVLEAWDGQGKG